MQSATRWRPAHAIRCATIYVTLEPCCHYGKQPPCTQAILNAGIKRVVVGSRDPNPLVSGNGIQMLREHGVEVPEGVLEDECARLNKVFFHYIQTKHPFVVMKYAMTLDGKIAGLHGRFKMDHGRGGKRTPQRQRHRYSGIMVGVGTVLTDDPRWPVTWRAGKTLSASFAIPICGRRCKRRW